MADPTVRVVARSSRWSRVEVCGEGGGAAARDGVRGTQSYGRRMLAARRRSGCSTQSRRARGGCWWVPCLLSSSRRRPLPPSPAPVHLAVSSRRPKFGSGKTEEGWMEKEERWFSVEVRDMEGERWFDLKGNMDISPILSLLKKSKMIL